MQPAAVILAFVVVGAVLTAWHTLRLGNFPGRTDYLMLMASGGWWAVSAFFDISASDPATKIFYAELAWYGIVTTPISWMLFMTAYIRGSDLPNAALHTGLAIAAGLVMLTIAMTNDVHHLVYVAITPAPTPAYPHQLHYEHGPVFFAAMIAIYFFMALTAVRTLRAAIRAPRVHRIQFIGLLVSAMVPWAANAAYNLAGIRVFGFDPTPLAYVLAPMIYGVLISRNQFLSLAPVAIGAVVAAHPDGILVVSGNGFIAEANAAMRAIFDGRQLVGQPFSELGATFGPADRASLFDGSELVHRWRRGDRVYEVRTMAVDAVRHSRSVAYVLRDITDYLRAQESLFVSTRLMEERLEANLRLQEQLHEMAHRDSLTGLHNRRILENISGRLIDTADAVGRSLVAVSLDLDHFKRLNDTYGHKAGDDALVAMAGVLARSLRPGEVAVRMGGEEFLVLMPNADIEEARARTEAWRAVIRAQPVATSQGAAEITFSAGISAYPDTAASFEQMLQQADKAVYAAKRAGRNRVVVARPPGELGDGRTRSA
ncbi:histidine kinase N-terminal 7TM domain-containing diguanylate cyclase [Pleomorphomonas carboxyditropha]|uniref:histidine kinase N-terminal 7TM domain-containing diguanylate cyclase n=1 Tax=Pleomorphomonas carboxyditropha TaxID=2023338 RepID=UPI0010559CB0|nr:diguanylate cyclase [Pleomorphomonas carboxyditropha]